MIDKGIQQCFLRSIIDNINPNWLLNCNFVNLYNQSNDNKKHFTCLYLSDDRKTLLYVTNKIFTMAKVDGRPWSQYYKHFLRGLFPDNHLTSMFYYSGLYFDEFTNSSEIYTLKEYIRLNPYDSNVLCNYLERVESLLNYHMIPFCFSEDLLLVDLNKTILLPSFNFLISISFPISEEMIYMFKNKLHPVVFNSMKQDKRNRNIIANTGAFDPIKMKKLCTRIIDREAMIDRVYGLSSIIYYIAYVGSLWKFQKQWPTQRQFKNTNQCGGICNYATNHLNGDQFKKRIHNYVCNDIINRLPGKLKKSTSTYTYFNEALSELRSYLKSLDDCFY